MTITHEQPELSLGEQIKRHRISKGLTQKELSIACGLSGDRSDISKMESDTRFPRRETLDRICQALECRLIIKLESLS